MARGLAGTLRVGFTESASWHVVVPDSFRQFRQGQPAAELQLSPLSSLEQVQAVRSGRLDAGFVFNMPKTDPELDQIQVALQKLVLAVPKGHPLTKSKSLRLRDLTDADFVWFPRRQSPAYYDRLMQACFRGGLTTPRIVQEAEDQATLLALVACRRGVAFVTDATRWRHPRTWCCDRGGRAATAGGADSKWKAHAGAKGVSSVAAVRRAPPVPRVVP